MAQNRVEKIAERFAVDLPKDYKVRSGDFLSIRPRHVMTHDNSAAVIPKFRSMGAEKVLDHTQPVFALDHDVQNKSPENLAKYISILYENLPLGQKMGMVGRKVVENKFSLKRTVNETFKVYKSIS